MSTVFSQDLVFSLDYFCGLWVLVIFKKLFNTTSKFISKKVSSQAEAQLLSQLQKSKPL